VAPNVLTLHANGLDHRVLEWSTGAARATAVLLHGYMDAASTWDLVAPRLVAAGYRVLAPDFRGFGEGARLGPGAYYHFPDYVFDVADIVDQACMGDAPFHLVGHSMGGTVASLYAGTFPERPMKLALLEGIGPPDNPPDIAPVRFRAWIEGVRTTRARGPDLRLASREDALRRLAANHSQVDLAILAHRLPHLLRELPDGGLVWKNDPLHRTTSPMPFFASMYMSFARKVTCPTLYVDGGAIGMHPEDEDARLACFRSLERLTIEGAGHMMHWTRPDDLARVLVTFFNG
jgi:pimeloyl-ACP methyl ester carboxylesterase